MPRYLLYHSQITLYLCICHIANWWVYRDKFRQFLIKENSKFQYESTYKSAVHVNLLRHHHILYIREFKLLFILRITFLSAVNSKSIKINTGYVLYKESEKLCDEGKFSMRYILDVNELIQRIDQLHLQFSKQTFWIPNVKLTKNSAFLLVESRNLFKALKNCVIFFLVYSWNTSNKINYRSY